jgi:hypothetical protein
MARDLGLSKTYVLQVLKTTLELKKYSLRWVPYTLNDHDKAVPLEKAARMLSILESLTAHARSRVLTADEPWFYFSYDHKCKWALARDHSMTKPKAFIKASKMMILVVWGVDVTALVKIIPPDLRSST